MSAAGTSLNFGGYVVLYVLLLILAEQIPVARGPLEEACTNFSLLIVSPRRRGLCKHGTKSAHQVGARSGSDLDQGTLTAKSELMCRGSTEGQDDS